MTILLVVVTAVAAILASVCFGLVVTIVGFNNRLEKAYKDVEAAEVRRRRAEHALRDSGLRPDEEVAAAARRRAEVERLTGELSRANATIKTLRAELAAARPDETSPDKTAGKSGKKTSEEEITEKVSSENTDEKTTPEIIDTEDQ